MTADQPQGAGRPFRLPEARTVGEAARPTAPADRRPAVDPTVFTAALRELRAQDDVVVDGLLVAGADGVVLFAETSGLQVDMFGVMAAVVSGVAAQLVESAGVGEPLACLFEGSSGHVAVFPLLAGMVLVVFGRHEVSTGRFNLAARGVLTRLREDLARGEAAGEDQPGDPTPA